MKRIGWVHVVLCTLIVASTIALRVYVLDVVTIGSDGCAPQLLHGDRVAVVRQSWHDTVPMLGDLVVFTHPDVQDSLMVGCIAAVPGDTLWIDSAGQLTQRSTASDLVVVPRSNQLLDVNLQDIRLYDQAIRLHEPSKSAIVDEQLYVSGRVIDHYRFAHSYYWIASNNPCQDSRTLGLIPEGDIRGYVRGVLYSHDPQQPLWQGWRLHRTMLFEL